MAAALSSLGGDKGSSGGNPPHGATSGGGAFHPGDSPGARGFETAKNQLKLRLAMPFTADDRVNPIPMLGKLLETALLYDPGSCLKSFKSSFSPIMSVNEIPKDEKVFAYAFDLQCLAAKKQFVFFALLETNISFNTLKFNTVLFNWLLKNKYFVGLNTLDTNHTTPLGFIYGVHPTLSSRDYMKELLDPYMHDIEYTLLPNNSFYIDEKGNRVNTRCVELQVDSAKANLARDRIASAWMDPNFIHELSHHSIRTSIEFVPYIKKGVMMPEVFRAAMKQQHEFNKNTIAISVLGIGGLEVEIERHGKPTSLVKMIHELRDSKGSAVFSGVEPTKFTAAEGRFLFLTQKPIIDEAEKLLDQLLEQLAYEGLLDAITMEGHKIRRLNQTQSKAMAKYAEGLATKFKPMESVTVPTSKPPLAPTRNAWNRTPQFKFDQENFPVLGSPSRIHAAKKRRTTEEDETQSQGSEPSQQTRETALTDERTEFVQQLSSSFMKKLALLKKDHEDQQKKFEARLYATEEALKQSQQQLLHEFQSMTTNYASAQQSYASLRNDFQTQRLVEDRRYFETQNSMSQMMKMLITMNQSLAAGNCPEPLMPAQIKEMEQLTHGQQSQEYVTPTHTQRNGAPGNSTERSTTDPNEGGRQN